MAVTFGAFTPETYAALLSQATPVEALQPTLYVNSYTGSNANVGTSPATALGTITQALSMAENGTTIGIFGVFREQVTTRLGLQDVTIVGLGNLPRQATTSGVANGGGATWLAPSSVTASAALLRIQGQGFRIENIYFNSTGITSNGAIEPHTVGDPPAQADGAHLQIVNCIITGAKYGIYCPTGTNFVRIIDSEIFGFGDSGDVAIQATGGIGTLLDWRIMNTKFYGNANHIIAALNKGTIKWCDFDAATAAINLTNGTAPNRVTWNTFDVNAADFDPAGGITGVTGDVWSNTLKDAIETGLPAN